MLMKMMCINNIFLIVSRFREIEVQMAENQSEITYNIFRKLTATRTFRNIFLAFAVVTQVVGTVLLIVVWNNYFSETDTP